jgi:L-threonylcarbamoyladenylate synthase
MLPFKPSLLAVSADAYRQAAELLALGGLVAFPTETVYGLGADAGNDRAVAAIFAAKGRPSFNPLIAHVLDREMAQSLAEMDARAHDLAAHFWPGPLTMVLPRKSGARLSHLASAGMDTVAVRCPAHPCARALLQCAGFPIVAPSANRSGRISPTTAWHVMEEFAAAEDAAMSQAAVGNTGIILAGGRCSIGLESTIVDLCGPAPLLLRPGLVGADAIAAILGVAPRLPTQADGIKAPGMLASHYAPRLPVRLEAESAQPNEAWLGFGPSLNRHHGQSLALACADEGGCHHPMALNLSTTGDLNEAAANLFAMLRALDHHRARSIAVAPIPDRGLGVAINDRLRRAAAAR